jgi:tetratricopeptide (TPR) repeat protein
LASSLHARCIDMKKILILVTVLFFSITSIASAQTLRAYLSAGDRSMDKSRYAEAIEYYRKALEFETNDPTISFKMAEASRLYKDYERAASWYGKIVMQDKEDRFPMAQFRFAEMKKYLGMYEESCRIYERYLNKFPSDTGYTGVKARTELAGCDKVIELSNRKPEAEIKNAGAPINTVYSEYGASMMEDTTLYYSSLRFLYEQTKKKEDNYYVSRILKSSPKPAKNTQPLPLSIMINEASSHNGNAAFSPDYRIMVFSRCPQPEGAYTLQCDLYWSRLEDGKFTRPERIGSNVNLEGTTSTQPALEARGADGYTLYFVSDRPGGFGGTDIYMSDFNARMEFDSVRNAGDVINTFDDEMTPWFDTPNRTLYFSSYGHIGLGGMDIFRSIRSDQGFQTAENMGPGYNTSVDDVYFTINRDGKSGTLSSNRAGSMFIRAKTCCYDIYYYNLIEMDTVITEVKTDSVALAITDSIAKTDPGNKAYYDDFLPLELYFDNDEPDKRTMAVTTNKSYDKLYRDYISRVPEYKSVFAGELSGEKKVQAEQRIDRFFNEVVTHSWNQLNGFCAKVEKALIAGVGIELEVRGRTSPLAESDYNVNLSRRRISSLVNFMKQYNNGSLRPYFNDGRLKVTEVPAGETLVRTGVSDQLSDKRNSVYNPDAAIERRIELINVNLVQPGP